MKRILEIATAEVGVKEVPGARHNERILQYSRDIGMSWINDDETPWCSIFMNWVAFKAGFERSEKANARSWLDVGVPTDRPEPGDVVVFWRNDPNSWQGHVGVFNGYSLDRSRVYTLGGNQSDQVNTSAYAANTVLGFRRLRPLGEAQVPNPVLRRGDNGDSVALLQDALKLAGFAPGVSDGIFGARTEEAVKGLQASGRRLGRDGVYDAKVQNHLKQVLDGEAARSYVAAARA